MDHNKRRAILILVVIGSIMALAATWNLPEGWPAAELENRVS
jgi:hypothetical protein